MKISEKIKEIKDKVYSLFFEEDTPDYIMVALEYNDHIGDSNISLWTASIIYENLGDGHPQYMDFEAVDRIILQGFGDTITAALLDLDKQITIYKET